MNWLRNIYNVCWGRITWGSSFETEGTFGSIESRKKQERHRKRGLQIACVSFTLYSHDIWQKDSKLFGEWPSSLHWRFLKVDFSLEFPSLLRIRKPILHCEFFLRLSSVFWNIHTKERKTLKLKSLIISICSFDWKIPCNCPIRIKKITPFLKSSIRSFTTMFMLTSCSFTKFLRFDVTYSNLSGVDSIKVSNPSFLSISLKKEFKMVCH